MGGFDPEYMDGLDDDLGDEGMAITDGDARSACFGATLAWFDIMTDLVVGLTMFVEGASGQLTLVALIVIAGAAMQVFVLAVSEALV